MVRVTLADDVYFCDIMSRTSKQPREIIFSLLRDDSRMIKYSKMTGDKLYDKSFCSRCPREPWTQLYVHPATNARDWIRENTNSEI